MSDEEKEAFEPIPPEYQDEDDQQSEGAQKESFQPPVDKSDRPFGKSSKK